MSESSSHPSLPQKPAPPLEFCFCLVLFSKAGPCCHLLGPTLLEAALLTNPHSEFSQDLPPPPHAYALDLVELFLLSPFLGSSETREEETQRGGSCKASSGSWGSWASTSPPPPNPIQRQTGFPVTVPYAESPSSAFPHVLAFPCPALYF